MLSALMCLVTFILKSAGYIILIIFLFALGYRLYVEPFKVRCKCKPKLNGKVVLITGGNSGIGFETAKDLAKRGARVIIASSNVKKSAQAVNIIKQVTGNNNVEYRHLDLLKLNSVREFAEKFNKDFDRLDILVNNAGRGKMEIGDTEQGIDLLMQINYLSPFLLTNLLLEKLTTSKPSRIVMVSSLLHYFVTVDPENMTSRDSVFFYSRYAKTKLCILLWTKELAKRLPEGVTVNVLHPGLVRTNIFETFNYVFRRYLYLHIYLLFKTAEEGAQTVIHLCVCPNLESSTGGYYQDCKKVNSSKTIEDRDLARRLWEKSISITTTRT